MENTQFQFHMVEYAGLRSKLDSTVGRSENIINVLTFANGVVASWILTNINSTTTSNRQLLYTTIAGFWIPFLLTTFSYFHFRSLRKGIQSIGQYIARLEEEFAAADLGWERGWRTKRGHVAIRSKGTVEIAFAAQLVISWLFGIVLTLQLFRGNI